MLKYLHIENIAVIEQTNIEFTEGFNVLTGETGAGKSIVIDAINAVLGERTSKDLIRSGCDKAIVSALFCALTDESVLLLSENGFQPDENGNVMIARVLSADGKGTIRINGMPATAAVLKNIAPYLINIHGQHDNQSLLQSENHYKYLDKLACNGNLFEKYKEDLENFKTIRKKLKSSEYDEDEKLRTVDLLTYQINEIKDADIQKGEYEKLKKKFEIARTLKSKIKVLDNVIKLLSGEDNNDGIIQNIDAVYRMMLSLKNDELNTAVSELADAINSIDSFYSEVRKFKDNLTTDEYDEEKIGDRLDFVKKIITKYGGSEESMFDFYADAQNRLHQIVCSEEEIEKLNEQLKLLQSRLIDSAKKLTQSRIDTAAVFEKQVCEVLEYLNMPSVRLKVQIDETSYSKSGCDDVKFLISANAGEELKPLVKVASGGELSRVMLALKSVFADKDDVDTLIFDEIDSGISGFAAEKVGTQLYKLARSRQVICVTHLAQIASKADNHLLIEKKVIDNRALTGVKTLDKEGRKYELARIIGGKITDTVLKSAEEMLK